MRNVEFEGGTVTYQVDGTGPGLVLVHGTGGDSENNWAHLVDHLSPCWTVVRPNYSGADATTDAGGPLRIALLAGQVVAAARAAGAVPFDLIGFSLGAAVAVHIAAEYPDLVRSVVLLGGFVSGADARQQMQFALWQALLKTDRESMARLILLTGYSPAFLSSLGAATIAEYLEGMLANNNWEGMARQIDLDLTIDIRSQAGRITQPTLIIACQQDQVVPPAQVRELAGFISHAVYIEMDTGHLATFERPTEFIALVKKFLRPQIASS